MSRILNIYIFSAERRAEMEMEIDSADTSQDIVPAPDVPDFQPVKEQFEKFSREAERRWAGDEQFRKAWTFFNKKMDKYFKGANSRLIRKLYDFGIENKRKNNPVMHVQPTSIARRKNKQKGRSVSRYGRRHKDTVRRTQVFEDENHCTQFLAGFKGTEVFPTTCRKLLREIDVQLKSIDEIYN